MFVRTVSEKRNASSNTTPTVPRSDAIRRSRMSTPATEIDPECTS